MSTYLQSASLQPGLYSKWISANCQANLTILVCCGVTSRGNEWQYLQLLHATETGISSGWKDCLAQVAHHEWEMWQPNDWPVRFYMKRPAYQPSGGGVVRLMLDGLVLNTSFWQCLSPFTLHIRSHLWWSWRRKRRHQVTRGLLWCSEATNRNTWFNPKAWQRRRIRLWGETLERKE